MSGERVASYDEFMNILADASKLGLCNAPDPSSIKNLTPGADVVLSLEEMGCDFTAFRAPYHHRVRAVVLYERTAHIVDIQDTTWVLLKTVEEWIASLPIMVLPAEVIAATEPDAPEEDGPAGVREPSEPAAPTDDAGAAVPHEAPVG